MHISQSIERLQTFRAQHGNIGVWVKDGSPFITLAIRDMYPPNPRPKDKPEKVVLIE